MLCCSCFTPLPKLTADGYRVVIFRIFDAENSSLPSPDNIIKATQIGLDISLKYDKFRGVTLIYDLENASMAFISLVIPMLKKIFALTSVSKILFLLYDPPGRKYMVVVPARRKLIVMANTVFVYIVVD